MGNGSATGCFRSNVADHYSVGGTAEATVGYQSDFVTKTGSDKSTGYGKHLGHTRGAFGTDIADYDHIAFMDIAFLNRFERIGLFVEDPGDPGEERRFMTGNLYDTAFRCETAF